MNSHKLLDNVQNAKNTNKKDENSIDNQPVDDEGCCLRQSALNLQDSHKFANDYQSRQQSELPQISYHLKPDNKSTRTIANHSVNHHQRSETLKSFHQIKQSLRQIDQELLSRFRSSRIPKKSEKVLNSNNNQTADSISSRNNIVLLPDISSQLTLVTMHNQQSLGVLSQEQLQLQQFSSLHQLDLLNRSEIIRKPSVTSKLTVPTAQGQLRNQSLEQIYKGNATNRIKSRPSNSKTQKQLEQLFLSYNQNLSQGPQQQQTKVKNLKSTSRNEQHASMESIYNESSQVRADSLTLNQQKGKVTISKLFHDGKATKHSRLRVNNERESNSKRKAAKSNISHNQKISLTEQSQLDLQQELYQSRNRVNDLQLGDSSLRSKPYKEKTQSPHDYLNTKKQKFKEPKLPNEITHTRSQDSKLNSLMQSHRNSPSPLEVSTLQRFKAAIHNFASNLIQDGIAMRNKSGLILQLPPKIKTFKGGSTVRKQNKEELNNETQKSKTQRISNKINLQSIVRDQQKTVEEMQLSQSISKDNNLHKRFTKLMQYNVDQQFGKITQMMKDKKQYRKEQLLSIDFQKRQKSKVYKRKVTFDFIQDNQGIEKNNATVNDMPKS